VCGQIIWNI